MNQPSKKQFFEYMSDTFGYEFGCERAYELLKDVIREAHNNQGTLKEFEELKQACDMQKSLEPLRLRFNTLFEELAESR